MRSRRGNRAWVIGALVAVAFPATARGYEFEVRARTTGQGAELRSFRLLGDRGLLTRRQITQSVSLRIWDLFVRRRDLLRKQRVDHNNGPKFYFHSNLRIDHDFGTFSAGDVQVGNRTLDAIDAVGELEERALQIDLSVAYIAADDLVGGILDVRLGRQTEIGGMDWVTYDGIYANVRTPARVAVAGYAGLRVRRDSFMGSAAAELDGTSDTGCEEYIEGPTPGSGSWRPIDIRPDDTDVFRADFDRCPQREVRMPVIGATLSTIGSTPVRARLDYRQSFSRPPGLIGDVDRFVFADTGLYPNGLGQTDGFATNEEIVAASVRVPLHMPASPTQVTPYGALRYSLLHGIVDQGHAGISLAHRRHSVESEVYYLFPTFDGDSIFNVFSIQPYADVRLTYAYELEGRASVYARGWGRNFYSEDDATDGTDGDATAGGLGLGGVLRLRRDRWLRLDVFHEDGHGGRRTGGYATGSIRVRRDLAISGRLSALSFDQPYRDDRDGFSGALEAGLSYRINRGLSARLVAEQTTSPLHPAAFRLLGVFDIAFHPDI